MSISSRRNEVNIYSSSSIPEPLDNALIRSEILEYPDNDDTNIINQLDIAEGLKDILFIHGFNLESLLIMRPHDLAEMLGIDVYVAKIIIGAAYDINKKISSKSNSHKDNL
jgi:hypothetical protein